MTAVCQQHHEVDAAAAPTRAGAKAPRRGVLPLRSFQLLDASESVDIELAWQDWGDEGAPVAIVLGGISAGRDIGGWWSEQCGPQRALDPDKLRLVSIDWIGGADASTGPGEREDFPAIDPVDQAHALLALINHFGISKVTAIVGASYGACVAQHLAVLLGSRLGHLVAIGAAHRASPWALALRTLQRAGIVAASAAQERSEALHRARQIAVLGYRTPDELEQRFGELDAQQGVLGWLSGHGDRFVARFSVAAFLCLSASLDAHRCDPASIRTASTIVAFDSDLIAPPRLMESFAAQVGASAEFVCLPSQYGHDAFLKETRAVADLLTAVVIGELA